MTTYRKIYNGDANNRITRFVDLREDGYYIEQFRQIVIDAYIPKYLLDLLSINLPSELINIIVLNICDTIVIKFNNNNFEFIDPSNNLILKTQMHDINNYYYVYPSYNNDDIYLFYSHYKTVSPEYLNVIGDDVYSLKTEPILKYISLLPTVNNTDYDKSYLEHIKDIYKKVNKIRDNIFNMQIQNIYADYKYQFSSDYKIYIIRSIVSFSNKLYNISVHNTMDNSIIISKNIKSNILINENMLSPVINNKTYLIFVSISKCDISNKMSVINIDIYNINTLELVKTFSNNDYIPSLYNIDITWNKFSVKIYNNCTKYNIIVNLF